MLVVPATNRPGWHPIVDQLRSVNAGRQKKDWAGLQRPAQTL